MALNVPSLQPLFNCKYSLFNTLSFEKDTEPKAKRLRGEESKKETKAYVLNVSVNHPNNDQLLVHVSDGRLHVVNQERYSVTRTVKVVQLNNSCNGLGRYFVGKSDNLSGRFDPNLVMLATHHTVNLWDLREKNLHSSGVCLAAKLGDNLLNILSFDVDVSSYLVAAGTEVADNDAYVCLWDLRKPSVLRGYDDWHSDDVTCVEFHPSCQNLLATGSDDNLVNVSDISVTIENETILHTLNADMSVSKIIWSNADAKKLFCVLEDEGLQLWNYEEVAPLKKITRKDYMSEAKNIVDFEFLNVVNIWNEGNNTFLAVSSKNGDVLINSYNYESKEDSECLTPHSGFTGGHTDLVRAISSSNNVLYTGGQDSRLCYWKLEDIKFEIKNDS